FKMWIGVRAMSDESLRLSAGQQHANGKSVESYEHNKQVNGENACAEPSHESVAANGDPPQFTVNEVNASVATPENEDVEAAVEDEHVNEPEETAVPDASVRKPVAVRRKRRPVMDAVEQRLLGRRALCKRIAEIAPDMLKTVKLR